MVLPVPAAFPHNGSGHAESRGPTTNATNEGLPEGVAPRSSSEPVPIALPAPYCGQTSPCDKTRPRRVVVKRFDDDPLGAPQWTPLKIEWR